MSEKFSDTKSSSDDDSFDFASECSSDENIVVEIHEEEDDAISCSADSSSSSSSFSMKSSLASSDSTFEMRNTNKVPGSVPVTYKKTEPKRDTINLDADDSTKCESEKPDDTVKPTLFFSYNNTIVPVALDEINSFDARTIPIAVMSDYKGSKTGCEFASVVFPAISMTYNSLVQLFFSCNQNFIPHVIKKIWRGITGLSLPHIFLQIYEKKHDVDRNQMCAVSKIKLYKYCSNFDIITKACHITALKLSDFNNALPSVEPTAEGEICVTVVVSLFSEAIETGVNFTIRMIVRDIPQCLCKEDENELGFDFNQ